MYDLPKRLTLLSEYNEFQLNQALDLCLTVHNENNFLMMNIYATKRKKLYI